MTGKLRSADCVAAGLVRVVVMNKKDFLALDNPLLSWMLDYDAVATVLKVGGGVWGSTKCPPQYSSLESCCGGNPAVLYASSRRSGIL